MADRAAGHAGSGHLGDRPGRRHAHKTVSRRQDGFKAHIAIEPDTGIITDCELTKTSGEHSGDAQVGPGLLADEPEPTVVPARGVAPRRSPAGRDP